jgi:hypothetical protein
VVIRDGTRTFVPTDSELYANEYSAPSSGGSAITQIDDFSGPRDWQDFDLDSGSNVFYRPSTITPDDGRYERAGSTADYMFSSAAVILYTTTVEGDGQEVSSTDVGGTANAWDPAPSKTSSQGLPPTWRPPSAERSPSRPAACTTWAPGAAPRTDLPRSGGPVLAGTGPLTRSSTSGYLGSE